jgi:hypothetical protein
MGTFGRNPCDHTNTVPLNAGVVRNMYGAVSDVVPTHVVINEAVVHVGSAA